LVESRTVVRENKYVSPVVGGKENSNGFRVGKSSEEERLRQEV
jgi:hypothetical protein